MKRIYLLLFSVLFSAFCASAHYYVPRFDPNQDGVSNVSDVTDLIDYLLTGYGEEGFNGDVSRDGRVYINDVTLMIDYLLQPEYYDQPQYEPEYPDFEIPEGAEVYEANGVSFAMVPIDTVDEQGNIVRKFSLGVTEVTIELWQAVMGENPTLVSESYHFISPRWPVSNICWYDANEFIEKLNELTGEVFRLPKTYEWSYAAHGGLLFHHFKYAGSDDPDEVCWYNDNLPNGFTIHMGGCPVGLKAPNELGLYDMSGNVSEWCFNGPDDINGTTGSKAYLAGGDVYNVANWCSINNTAYYDIKNVDQGQFGQGRAVFRGMRLAM